MFLFWIPRIQNVLHIDGISRETDDLWESPWPRQWADYRITGGGISRNSLRVPTSRSQTISGIVDACCAMMRPACSRMQVKVHNNLNSARVEYFVDDFPPSVDCFWHRMHTCRTEWCEAEDDYSRHQINAWKKNQLRSNSVIYQNNSISDIYIAVWIVFLLTVLSKLSQQFYMPLI